MNSFIVKSNKDDLCGGKDKVWIIIGRNIKMLFCGRLFLPN